MSLRSYSLTVIVSAGLCESHVGVWMEIAQDEIVPLRW